MFKRAPSVTVWKFSYQKHWWKLLKEKNTALCDRKHDSIVTYFVNCCSKSLAECFVLLSVLEKRQQEWLITIKEAKGGFLILLKGVQLAKENLLACMLRHSTYQFLYFDDIWCIIPVRKKNFKRHRFHAGIHHVHTVRDALSSLWGIRNK